MGDDDTSQKPKAKHVCVPESPHVLAMRALKAINKSSPSELQITEVPSEFLFGEHINFSIWSLILNDKSLIELSQQAQRTKRYFLNATSSYHVPDLFKTFWTPLTCPKGIISLNLRDSKGIQDYGLTMILRNNIHIEKLNISKCIQITDVAIREIGLNCVIIQELNISSCLEIDGCGLVAVAECCHNLVKLNISRCKKIQKYAITKLFYHCIRLEEVNVSYLTVITDEEIRTLAQNCVNLLKLIAVECVYLSDQTVIYLSQNCVDIDYIDISRSTMTFRITDVALSALGQKSFTLRTLKVTGCDQLTDVGITWLVEGCKALTELDFNKCNRITDAGLRNIGNACHSLTSFDISHARTVTDIGLASLSSGCPQLKHLKCHGLFLLSDPRLSAPTKGAKLESWQSVIGVAALANNCHDVEVLDLSGCFRLNIALHSYVSSLQHLRVLNLSGCNQSTPESLEAVAKGCTLLEDLNLTDCGKSVNNKSVAKFAQNCLALHTLNLTRCEHVKSGAIKAIAYYCNALTTLNITHCKLLTNNSLLYLCEVEKCMKLRNLYITDCEQITDSLLAWLSIKQHNLILLAVKGTIISRKALMSVRDRYPNSDMVYTSEFIGFQPKYRVNDHIFINKYYSVVNGIIKIQSKLRVLRAKRRVCTIVFDRAVYNARCLIQRTVRGFLGRCIVFHKRAQTEKVHNSAMIITAIFRRVVALAKVRYLRSVKHEFFRHSKAKKIQLCFRKHRDYTMLQMLKHKRCLYQQMRIFKATKIQSIARVYFAKSRVANIKLMIRKHDEVINRKAAMIQRGFRGYIARKTTAIFKAYHDSLAARKYAAVVRIQRTVRGMRTATIMQQMIDKRKHKLHCCVLIQALIRGALARIHVAEIATEDYERRKKIAATKIQSRLRILRAVMELKVRVRSKMADNRHFATAANIIIRQARVKLAVLKVQRQRAIKLEFLRQKAILEIQSAVKIQSVVRGIKGRELFVKKLREKKGKWKELFDEEKQQRFFYNKLSGEIRYRMPQDLLDLIPKPHCDNCVKCNAIVECSVCNELFCQSCFNTVHSGGRRAEHPFRALYDYYNKRLDYGDGVFPCKWPSEVMQDEVQGWMLRIAPIRNPIKTYPDGWEVYNENTPDTYAKKHSDVYNRLYDTINTSGNSGENRLFYFNRITFETCYDIPESVRQAQERDALRTANNTVIYNTGYYDSNNMWIDDTRPNTYDDPNRGPYTADNMVLQQHEQMMRGYDKSGMVYGDYVNSDQQQQEQHEQYASYPFSPNNGRSGTGGSARNGGINGNGIAYGRTASMKFELSPTAVINGGGDGQYQSQQRSFTFDQAQQQQPHHFHQQQQYQQQQMTNTSHYSTQQRQQHQHQQQQQQQQSSNPYYLGSAYNTNAQHTAHYMSGGNDIIDVNYNYSISDDQSGSMSHPYTNPTVAGDGGGGDYGSVITSAEESYFHVPEQHPTGSRQQQQQQQHQLRQSASQPLIDRSACDQHQQQSSDVVAVGARGGSAGSGLKKKRPTIVPKHIYSTNG